jgi:hypothetical protein
LSDDRRVSTKIGVNEDTKGVILSVGDKTYEYTAAAARELASCLLEASNYFTPPEKLN